MKTTNANTIKQFLLLKGDMAKLTTAMSHEKTPTHHSSNLTKQAPFGSIHGENVKSKQTFALPIELR